MKTSFLLRSAALAVSLLGLISATNAATPWTARVRATYVEMADRSNAFSALGVNFAADSVKVNSKWIPELDFSYALNDNLSLELVLTIPQSQNVTLSGVGKLGSFKHLPPVLTAQYRFGAPNAAIQPYIGAGANFTLIYNTNLRVANVPLSLENYSLGLAAQAGVDFHIGNGMYVNLDAKRAQLRTDVLAGGARLTVAKLDPWLYSIGLGWRF